MYITYVHILRRLSTYIRDSKEIVFKHDCEKSLKILYIILDITFLNLMSQKQKQNQIIERLKLNMETTSHFSTSILVI